MHSLSLEDPRSHRRASCGVVVFCLSTMPVLACTQDTRSAPDDDTMEDALGTSPSARSDAFFTAFPQTATTTVAGRTYPQPFKAYDIDSFQIIGTAKYSEVADIAKGSGYAPVKTTVWGVERAIVHVG